MAKKSYNEKLRHSGDLPKVENISHSKQAERLFVAGYEEKLFPLAEADNI